MEDQAPTYEQLLRVNAALRCRVAALEKAAEEMGSREDLCRQLVENATDIIFQCDRQGRFVYVNPVAVRILGYPQEELIDRHYLDLIKPDGRQAAAQFYGRQFVKKIKNTYYEYPIITKEGKEIWIGQNVQIILDGDTVTGFRAVARDITDRRQAQEALRETANRLNNLYENSPDILYSLNRDGIFESLNNSVVDVLGYPNRETALEDYVSKVVHPEDRDEVMTSFCDAVAAKQTFTKGLTFRLVKSNGEIIWVELHSRINYDEDGEFVEEFGILRDVTERRQMEEQLIRLNRELEETNKKLQAAYQWMRDSRDQLRQYRYKEDIGFVVDRDGRIEWISETVLSLSGKSRQELIGGNLSDLLHVDNREAFGQALRQAWMGITYPFSSRFLLMGGADVIVDMKLTRMTSRDTRRLWVLFQIPGEKAMQAVGT